ncbi:MAG TPA: DUF4093 domain-containing protein [Bacilli bacterium]|nr:DUF4093 domain-containing protein [Bacilli bacterium]
MYYFDGVIVVEGKTDVAFLSSFIKAEYVMTNGYQLTEAELEYLNAVAVKKTVLIITDPDHAGEVIRSKIKIPKAYDIFLDINCCNKNGKHGVAECDKEEIARKLKGFFTECVQNQNEITTSFLISLGLDNKNKRAIFAKKVHVGIVNMKKLSTRLNTLGYTEKDFI